MYYAASLTASVEVTTAIAPDPLTTITEITGDVALGPGQGYLIHLQYATQAGGLLAVPFDASNS